MPLTVGTGAGEFPSTIRHVENGEPASATVFKRPSQDLEARTDALKAFVEAEETQFDNHDHTGSAKGNKLSGANCLTDLNTANGICQLDANAKVKLSQLPAGILGGLKFQGTWNAATNTPALAQPVASASPDNNGATATLGNEGQYYIVGTAGNGNSSPYIGSETDFKPGDWVVNDGAAWVKIDNTTEPNLALLNALAFGVDKAGYAIVVKADGTGYELADHGPRLQDAEDAIYYQNQRLQAIESNTPVEEVYPVTGSPTDVVTFNEVTFNASNSVLDIEVYILGSCMDQDQDHDGNLLTPIAQDFAKVGTATLKFAETLPVGTRVKVRRQGTSSGVDLQKIATSPQPVTNGGLSLGAVAKAWDALYLKDSMTGTVYKLQVTNGVLGITAA